MEKRISVLILVLLLASYTPIAISESDNGDQNANPLERQNTRIEISPNPDSIQDLGSPTFTQGTEGTRVAVAESSIGVFTDLGLVLSKDVPERLQSTRSDLMLVLINPDVGLWDARTQIIEAADVAVRSTIPPSGFLLQGSADELSEVSELTTVTSSHQVPVAMMIDSQLWEDDSQSIVEVELLGWKDEELNRLDVPGHGIDGSLSKLASESLGEAWSPDTGIHFGTVSPSESMVLAMYPQVSFISLTPEMYISNNLVRNHMGVGVAETAYISGLNGSGQRVAVADTGIDHDHGDFGSRIVQRIDVAGDGSTADTNDGHGTHVSCTVLGSGFRTSTYEGVAPEAELYLQAMEDDNSGTLSGPGVYTLLNTAYNSGGARIHTNSWGGFDSGGDYTTQSEDADDRTSTWDQYWTYQGMTVLFAAGNERDEGVSPPGTAKNVITVGAHVNRYSTDAADEMYYWSSRGPTDDGRIKPDLVAPGDYVRSCRAQEATDAPNNINDEWYVEYSGTSMSTPAAAGASAIVREYLMEIAERPAPQGALVKAMLILGAEDMGTRDIPNMDEGWGRLNLVNTLVPDGDIGTFVDDRSRLSSGQQAEYNFDVTFPGEPLKIVLAWSDYPGSTWSSTQLRNDLNLEVTSPDGDIYYGNDFSNGRSTTGGARDNKNNVEVVLIDSAETGIWNVNVKDFSHGGSRAYQPFAIAVRGVNVNDLTPDPTFIPNSFELSTPIPQVGEQTQFSVSIINQGTGSFSEVHISAYVNSDHIGTKTLGMSPAEDVLLEWDWTPVAEDKGDTQIRIEIDPNDQLEELYEDNNILSIMVQVSAPGIQASSDSPWETLEGSADTTTTWPILMTNLALFETNASISASGLVRTRDGATFDWFKSFDYVYVNLGPAETATVNLTLVHGPSPDPGTYVMVVTATDVEFDIESQLEIFFDVPVLAQPEVTLPSDSVGVDSFEITELTVGISNRGNGAQTYDVELVSPAGWEVGFDDLGPFPGSNQGSTGTLAKDGSVSADITIVPPGVMINKGSSFTAQLLVNSRVSAESWAYNLNLVIDAYDSVSFEPSSGGDVAGVPSNALHEISLQIVNQGNRDLLLNTIERSLPGGWSISGGLDNISVERGSSVEWSFSIQGNGLAEGGKVEIRFLNQDGSFFDWNTTLQVVSAAAPTISFHEIVFVSGTSVETSENLLGLGAHPVGAPGFDMAWKVTNDGSSNWQPDANMELPGQDWSSTCTVNPSVIEAGQTATVWCTIVIPEHEEAGSEPLVALVLSGEGVESRETFSLLVQTVNEVRWNLQDMGEAHQGYSTTLYLELQNTGNTPISNRISAEGPLGWDIRILDGIMVTLQPDETRSVQISFSPNTGADGEITLMLADAEHIDGRSISLPIDVIPDPSSGGTSIWAFAIVAILLSSLGAAGAVLYRRSDGDIGAIMDVLRSSNKQAEQHSDEPVPLGVARENSSDEVQFAQPQATASENSLESYSEYPGWLWDSTKEEWIPDPDYSDEDES